MFDQLDSQVGLAQLDQQKIQREPASKTFAELKLLDNAELALVGGGGAHGGNFL